MFSESRVSSDEPLGLIFVLYIFELELLCVRPPAGLAVFVRVGTAWGDFARGDFARTVLGCEPVVDVRSVMESCSLMLDRDAVCRWPAGVVTRVPLSTLWRPDSISRCRASEFLRVLLALAVFLKSAAVVAVSGGLGGARGGGGGARVGVGGTDGSFFSSCEPSTSVRSGVMAAFLLSSSLAYMLSLLYVLSTEGYGRLVLELFAEPSSDLLIISGTTAILCDFEAVVDDDEVRLMRSLEERSRGRSCSVSSSLEADERVLRLLMLLWRSSLSLLLGLVRSRSRSRSGSFSFLRRRWESDELSIF